MPVKLVMTSATRSPLAMGSGGTSVFQATPLIDQMYFDISPVRSMLWTRSGRRGASGSSARSRLSNSIVIAGAAAGAWAGTRAIAALPALSTMPVRLRSPSTVASSG